MAEWFGIGGSDLVVIYGLSEGYAQRKESVCYRFCQCGDGGFCYWSHFGHRWLGMHFSPAALFDTGFVLL